MIETNTGKTVTAYPFKYTPLTTYDKPDDNEYSFKEGAQLMKWTNEETGVACKHNNIEKMVDFVESRKLGRDILITTCLDCGKDLAYK